MLGFLAQNETWKITGLLGVRFLAKIAVLKPETALNRVRILPVSRSISALVCPFPVPWIKTRSRW